MRVLVVNHADPGERLRAESLEVLLRELRRQHEFSPRAFRKSLRVTVLDAPEPLQQLTNVLTAVQPHVVIHTFSLQACFTFSEHPSLAGSAQFALLDCPSGEYVFRRLGRLGRAADFRVFSDDLAALAVNAARAVLASTEEVVLDQFCGILGERKTPARGFVRIDDAPAATKVDVVAAKELCESSIPVLVNLIPAACDADSVEDWLALQREHPVRVVFGQHGWLHADHGQLSAKQEFGEMRSYKQQLEDIQRGKTVLESLLGQHVDVFCPPFNHFDENTLRVLDGLDFRFLTGDFIIRKWTSIPVQLPATVDPLRWSSGEAMPGTLNHLIGSMVCAVRDERACSFGITLHPEKTPPDLWRSISKVLTQLGSSQAVIWRTPETLVESSEIGVSPEQAP